VSATDHVTVLCAVDGAVLTKRISQDESGEWATVPYDRAFLFSVKEVPITGMVDFGATLDRVSRDPHACVIRGRPKPGIDRKRCWRLIYDTVDESGRTRTATFEAAARRHIALDFDNLPVMTWNPEGLARRRAAIERDRAANSFGAETKGEDDGEDFDLAGDLDPAPVDPVKDWALVCRQAIATLPAEFHGRSCWWQMTSSAGIKPGIRLRLWFLLDRAVTDEECKVWLADAPVDRSLFNPIQVHYVARPIFDPPELDPVPLRSGYFWQHANAIEVPEIELPAPPPATVGAIKWEPLKVKAGEHQEIARQCLARGLTTWERDFCKKMARLASITEGQAETLARIADPLPGRAKRYAERALEGVRGAMPGDRHPTLMSVGVRLYSLADAGLLDPRRDDPAIAGRS
jgi:hypothetical protein